MITKIISIILLIDSFFALLLIIFGHQWYIKNFQIISRWLPLTIPWVVWYCILTIWIAILTFKII